MATASVIFAGPMTYCYYYYYVAGNAPFVNRKNDESQACKRIPQCLFDWDYFLLLHHEDIAGTALFKL
jgi:hypothetical protein